MTTSYLQKIINSFTFTCSPKSLPEDIEDDFFIITYQDISEYDQSFFICLDKSIIIIDKPKFQQFIEIYPKKTYYYIYDFPDDTKNILTEATNPSINLEATKFTIDDIQSFINSFLYTKKQFFKNKKESKNLLNTKLQLIVAHILQKSLMKTRINRIEKAEEFINKKPQINNYKLNEFIKLSNLGRGGSGFVEMAFHIRTEKLYALKNSYQKEKDIETLEREYDNYSKICYFPFLPKFYGKIRPENYLVIDYIEGLPLDKIKELKLNLFEKIMIILEIMFAVKFLHENNFVYRDLKPNNVIIDHNKTAVLIDFNRMIEQSNDYIGTADFFHIYMAPEIVNRKPFSYKADIYSIGFLIYYIIFEDCPDKKNEDDKKYQEIKAICENCTQIDHDRRPDIDELIHNFIYYFSFPIILFNIDKDENYYIFCKLLSTNTKSSSFKDIYEVINICRIKKMKSINDIYLCLGEIYYLAKYVPRDMNKSIHYLTLSSNQNNSYAQCRLGIIYYLAKYVPRDMNKSIHYLTLSSNQNNSYAQYRLGEIYYLAEYVPRDMNKSIHYLTLSSNQNNSYAQYRLGIIYYLAKYVPRDMNKSIHYLTLSSNQNNSYAQYLLGEIYYFAEYVPRDMNKSIHYLTLSSNQNNSYAQCRLGEIYYLAEYVPRDMSKSIHYLTLSSNQNNSYAQCRLGIIYYLAKYVPRDMNKSIHYLTLSSNQNNSDAQYCLGIIYYLAKYVPRDMNKSIHYLTLSSNQNNSYAQYLLGEIYYLAEYVPRDMNKSIHYLTLSSNQNNSYAQYRLGIIYYLAEYVPRDMNKSIHYLTLSSNQNNSDAQYRLGIIYYLAEYVPRDMNKSIHYLTLSSNQNNSDAQYLLGEIYYLAEYVPRDMNKSIHYLTLSSNQNNSYAQYRLGIIYYLAKYVPRDMNKSIHYLTLSSNQNNSDAQYLLGEIYYLAEYVPRDMNKSIHYLTLSSNQNNSYAQYRLGEIYYLAEYVPRDMNKSIHYLTLSSNQNNSDAQYRLGEIYYLAEYVPRDMNKSIHYLTLSSNQNNIFHKISAFYLGFIYSTKILNKQNFTESIRYYKEGSSLNNVKCKNNLGVIFYNGLDNKKNTQYAMELFNEAIKLENDPVSMYNLSIIYFYEKIKENYLEKAIELLLNSYNQNFKEGTDFLCLVLVTFCEEISLEKIKEILNKFNSADDRLSYHLYHIIKTNRMEKSVSNSNYETFYEFYKTQSYMFNTEGPPTPVYDTINIKFEDDKKENIYPNQKEINSLFYEGFDIEI